MIEIFYYSGTGFTLKAAKMMKELLGEEVSLIPILGVMQSGVMKTQAEKVGLLFPMHAFGLPKACQEFMKDFKFPHAKYVFSMVVRGGAPTRIHKEIERYLKKQGLKLNAFAYATAPNTFEVVRKVPVAQAVIEERVLFDQRIREFTEVVRKNQDLIKLGYRNRLLEYIIFPMIKLMSRKMEYFSLQNDFYADEKCVQCGRCKEVCLSNRISMDGGVPKWHHELPCQYCLACIHLCPQKAIQIKKTKSKEVDRIYEKNLNYKDISSQKELNIL